MGKQQTSMPERYAVDFSITLRQGVPDNLKHDIWPLAAGLKTSLAQAESQYDRLLRRAFGEAIPVTFEGPVPTFSQGIQGHELLALDEAVPHVNLLNNEGRE